jgi:integrase
VRWKKKARYDGEQRCAVPGCSRPSRCDPEKLCGAHHIQRTKSFKLPLAAFLADPRVRPMPSFGPCRVAACHRLAHSRKGLCHPHDGRWLAWRREHPDAGQAEFVAWCQAQEPISEGSAVVLRGLPRLVQTELLYGLQERCRRQCCTKLQALRTLCRQLRQAGISSFAELPTYRAKVPEFLQVANEVRVVALRALSSPEAEQQKDVWDMVVFGYGLANATLDFTKLSQPWLRQAAKRWVAEELPRRRGDNRHSVLRDHVNSLARLSESLRLHRDDHGDDPAALGRQDVVAFLGRLAHQEATGAISTRCRWKVLRHVAKILRDCRDLGLAGPSGPMAGLPDDFGLRRDDVPYQPDPDRPWKAIPPEVLRQVYAALPTLEARSGREMRVAAALLIDTGRRPDEVCALPWDCLDRDPEGKAVLVYTDFKNNRTGRRLPISEATAALILEQQQHVRTRFPTTSTTNLVLLPRAKRNPDGTAPLKDYILGNSHRRWVTTLPPLVMLDGQGKEVEFDKAAVFPYAYRHSYAQRHADAGTPIDVLRDLMGHRRMDTTQLYYRVTGKRTREAVDKLAAFQFDGRGRRVWREARALLEHEHQRRGVGQVAVPFGICTEPSNVQAGGHACPFRFRCHGCGHFRSDPSYLPELRSYLDMLLRNRERVRAATELEEWARAEATPSDEEIGRVRALIRRIEAELDQLSDDERRQVEEAVRVVRATRQVVHLGMPTVRPPDLDPTLALNQEQPA